MRSYLGEARGLTILERWRLATPRRCRLSFAWRNWCATGVWGLRAGTVRLAFGLLQVIAANLKPRRPEPLFHAVAERPGSVELNGLEDSPFLWPFERFLLMGKEPARPHVARDLGASFDRADHMIRLS